MCFFSLSVSRLLPAVYDLVAMQLKVILFKEIMLKERQSMCLFLAIRSAAVQMFVLCIFLMLMLFLQSPLSASIAGDPAQHGLRVVMDNSYPPYSFVNSNGQVVGILVDQWRLWQDKTGVRVEIVAVDRQAALKGIQAGEYDVLDTVFTTKEQKTWYDLGQVHARIDVVACFTPEIRTITTVESLQGFAVALKQDDAAVNLLRDHDVNNLVLFDGYGKIVQAAKDHKINVFVGDGPPLLYYLHKYGLQNDFKVSAPLTAGAFHRAVRKGNTGVLSTVETGFALLTSEELVHIDRKWSEPSLFDRFSLSSFLIGFGSLGLVLALFFLRNRSLLPIVRQQRPEPEKSGETLTESEVRYRELAEQALQREQGRLNFVLDGLRLGFWEWNVQTDETVFSPLWAELIGYELEELLPMDHPSWERIVHPDDADRVREALSAYVEGRAPAYDCEYRMRHKDGHWVWILDRARIFTRDGSGKPMWLFGVHADITPARRAGETMLADSGLLAQFIRNSPIYAYINEVSPTESRCLKASDNFQDLLGIPLADIPGKTMTELFEPPLADQITAENWQVISLRKTMQSTDVWKERTYSTIKFPIVQGERRLLGGYTIDITDIIQTEAALRESEATFRNIVQASPIGIHLYRLNADEGFVLFGANPAADRIIGINSSQYFGMTMEEIFPILRGTDCPDHYRKVARSGETWQGEYVLKADGRIDRAFEVHVFQITQGKAAVLFNEISARKQAEAERERLQEQLIQAQKMESVGRLAGGVAHDFNNMLSAILGHCELAMGKLSAQHPLFSNLQHIRTAAERSADLTRQLLAFARRQPIAPKVLDINTTVAGMLQMLERLIGEDIHLVWQPGNVGQVRIDPSQLDQILINLCVNARDAIRDTGTVTIETKTVTIDQQQDGNHCEAVPGAYIMLSVSDDGYGMDAAALSHLFEPFYTTKEIGKGTGLGLAMVYGIVQQNKGLITVESEPGQGTALQIYLPCHEACAGQPVEDAVNQVAVTTGNETVLVVEDEPMILEVTTTMLESLGYTVLPMPGPVEAIRCVHEYSGTIHLMLTDVIMPKMNGRLLAERLQTLIPGLRCVFMSGYTADVIAYHGVLDEGMHFIQKPFTVQVLAGKIREVLAH